MKKVMIEFDIPDYITGNLDVLLKAGGNRDFHIIENCMSGQHIIKNERDTWDKIFKLKEGTRPSVVSKTNQRSIFVIDKLSLDRYYSVGTQEELVISDGDTFTYVKKSIMQSKDGPVINPNVGESFTTTNINSIAGRYFSNNDDDTVEFVFDTTICHDCGKLGNKDFNCDCEDLPF